MLSAPKTDPAFLERLYAAARNHVMTPAEISEQRLSWVYGQLDDGRSKAEVREQLERMALILPQRSPP